jgi:hypothetical protein
MIRNSIARAVSSLVTRPVNGAKLSFEIVMKNLFSNGEQGLFYDPNDLSTMFQDSAGTVPVTAAGQPVGLVLDKSKGLALGGELWNDSVVAPTGGSSKISHGVYRIYSSDGTYSAINIGGVLTVGALYKLTFNIDSITLLGTGIVNEGNPASIFNSLGKKTVYFFATAAAMSLKRAGSACDIQISNVSVKHVAGNHAYQTTSAARPILQDAPKRIDFDAVDDKLITNLPAQLTGCTVIRSVPNVGTQILTVQTIPATYEDNKDHCGLIVINRALTPSETSAITAELNKRAGV